jgi:ABC-type phosphate transport system permease subunit
VVIFISMIVGSLIMWLVGVLLAVPIAVIITMFVDGKFENEW